MSMEFFAWPWAEGFFGEDARKFRYSHLAGALTFIPYGTMVDHFQHIVYEKPDMTPAQRHDDVEGAARHLHAVDEAWTARSRSTARARAGSVSTHIYSKPVLLY